MKVTVLGGTGQAGRQLVRLLLQDPEVEVLACARRQDRLDALRSAHGDSAGLLRTAVVDLSEPTQLDAVLEPADLVVGATSSWRDGPLIATRAVQHGRSYFGIYLSSQEKWRALRVLRDECVQRQVTVVDDGGAHPGLPSAMIRLMASETPLSSAWVGASFGLQWRELDLAGETIHDFVAELREAEPRLLEDGRWIRGYRHARRFDFGGRGPPASCVPMHLEEISDVADGLPSLQSAGFFIAGFGVVVDYGTLPIALVLSRFAPGLAARLLWWSLKRFGSAEPFAVLALVAEESHTGRELRLVVSHRDPYFLTAASAVAAIRQILAAPKAGVWTQASVVEPDSFFAQLEQFGVAVERPPP